MNIIRISAVNILLLCTATLLFAQGYDTYNGFTTPTTPILPAIEKHPSLFFDSVQLPSIILRKEYPAYSSIWSRVTSNINSYKTKTASSQNCSTRTKMAKYCALGWILNGDTTAKQKAIDALMLAYDNVPRTATSANFDKPYDEIYRATWLQNYCEAYDWVYGELTPEQNDTIRRKLSEEAELLCNNMQAGVRYSPRPHNHRSKPAYALGTAALTLTSHPLAAKWLDSALTNLNTVTKYQFSSDGIYREGSHYYIYSVVNMIPFLWHYKNVSGVDLFPYYQPAFEWPVLIRDQRGWMPNNEDGYLKPAPTHMVAKAYTSASTRLHSTEPLSSILQWNWATTNFFTIDYTGATNDVCWDVDEFLTYDATIPSVQPDANPTLKLATGQVVFRNSWASVDSTMRYLLYLGVAAADNHDHPDELSYIINARNSCLALDAGYGQDFWNYSSWYTKPLAHNLVMTNDVAPSDFAVNQTPTDLHFLTSPIIDFSEKEAKTSATSGRIRRGIAFINNDYWVIYDLPASSAASTVYKLNIHGRGSLSQSENQATWTVSSSSKYGAPAKLHTYFQTTETPIITQKTGNTSLFKDSIAQTYIEVKQTKDTVGFLHLMSTTASNDFAPSVTDISSGLVKGFERYIDPSTTDGFILQKNKLLNTAGYITTDGIFAWTRRNGSTLQSFMMNDGTVFRWNGADVVTSTQPVALAFSTQIDSLPWLVVDSLATATTFNVKITNVQTVKLNGAPIQFTAQVDGSVSFMISNSGKVEFFKTATSVNGASYAQPLQFKLEQNYPNPFNPTTTIRYELSVTSQVALRVYDLLGREVAVLVNEYKPAGKYSVQWNASGMSSGLYFARLESVGKVQMQKLVLMK